MKESKNLVQFSIGAECISCAACWRAVPEHFDAHVVHGSAVVSRQPESADEALRCDEALRICPVGAITKVPRENR